MKKAIIIASLLLTAITLPRCADQEEQRAKKLVELKMQNAKVTWIRKDSCYSVTRPMMYLEYQSIDANTRAGIDNIHEKAMQLGQQLDDRFTDHGGLKVSCYVVGYTYGASTDSTFVIVEPDGELVIDLDERTAWFNALGTIGEKVNLIYSN